MTEFLQTRALALFEWLKHPDHFRAVADLMLTPGWWQLLLCFTAASFLMIHRLNAVERNGFEGTLVGTLVMPYFSGFPNLCFAYLLARKGSDGAAVLENCLVNNVTNLTLVLAIPALFWGLDLFRKGKKTHDDDSRIHHLSLLLSLLAMIFFLAAVYVVSRDGKITAPDGMILVGIFFFWQLYHVFDVLKNNTRKERGIKKRIVIDFLIIGICAWGIFSSTDKLVSLILSRDAGFFSKTNIGFLSGILMVVPNAFLAFYYSAVKRADIAYSSQVGDCHICIPLCVGLFALFTPITVPPSFETAIFILMGASAGHFLFMAVLGRLPRVSGLILTGLYAFFLYKEII